MSSLGGAVSLVYDAVVRTGVSRVKNGFRGRGPNRGLDHMTTTQRRIALLTGASLATLGIAAPAYAATTVPGVCSGGTGPNVVDTIDITLLGHTGVTDTANPANATVTNCGNGEVVQGGNATGVAPPNGDVTLLITNGAAGDVVIEALASASNPAGNATASASIFNYGVGQLGNGAGTVHIEIDNAGHLGVAAVANANATGVANASANYSGSNIPGFGFGIYQSATGGNHGGASSLTAVLSNAAGATIDVTGSANAVGATANAQAHPDVGVWQIGSGGNTISVELTNHGALNVLSHAYASGTAGSANATADLYGGVIQAAYNGTTLNDTLTNTGLDGSRKTRIILTRSRTIRRKCRPIFFWPSVRRSRSSL